MRLTSESKFLLGIVVVTVALIGGAIFLFSKQAAPQPTIPKEALVTEGSYTKGNASASAYLVEFSDFQCPACKAFQPVVDGLVEKHKDELLFAYRYFPLDQHQYALDAAKAAEAAGQQDKFWEMYALLFAHQDTFSATTWSQLAKDLKLDLGQFETVQGAPKTKDIIERDRTYGLKIGVNSTPTFFLNGKKITVTSFEDFTKQVEAGIK